MKQSRFTRLLIQPTAVGLLGVFGLSLGVMFLSGFSYATKNNLLYDYLFGSNSSAALIETSRSTITVFNEAVFGNPTLNKILFFAFWMVVGLVVYVFISGIGAGISTAEHTLEEATFVHAQKLRLGSELGLRVVLHIIGAGLLMIYLIFFFKILLPFGVLCSRIVAGDIRQLSNWIYAVLGFTVLSAAFYLGIILLRFLLLRPRLFGGSEGIVADDLEHSSHNQT